MRDSIIRPGQVLTGPQFSEPMRVETVRPNGPDAWVAGLVGVLPLVVGFLTFAETAVFDPVTRTISDRPLGWALCNYSGVSDGRDEFRGYFRNRRKADA